MQPTTEAPVEEAQPEAEATIDALAQLTLTFMADGGIHMAIAGDLRPSIAWALGEFLRSVGDDMFQAAKQEAVKKLQATQQAQQRIVVPQSGLTRLPR